jgi:ribonuclease Z
MHLMGRTSPLNLFGPKGLSDIITLQLKYSDTSFNYDVIYHEIDTEKHQMIYEDDHAEVYTIPLDHRIPCSGFLFKEKPKKFRINKEVIPEGLAISKIQKLKNGEDVLDENGSVELDHRLYTKPPRKSFSYAFCSDTKYTESIIPIIQNVDLLYHEATFLDEHMDRAANTYHSTAKEAATIAKKAGVGQLLLGHFSVRYKALSPLEEEARTVFENSHLAIEGKEFLLHD